MEDDLWGVLLYQATAPPCLIIWARVRWCLPRKHRRIHISFWKFKPMLGGYCILSIDKARMQLRWLPSCTISPSLSPIFISNIRSVRFSLVLYLDVSWFQNAAIFLTISTDDHWNGWRLVWPVIIRLSSKYLCIVILQK